MRFGVLSLILIRPKFTTDAENNLCSKQRLTMQTICGMKFALQDNDAVRDKKSSIEDALAIFENSVIKASSQN